MDELIDFSSANGYTTVGIPSRINNPYNGYDIDKLYERDRTWSKNDIIAKIIPVIIK